MRRPLRACLCALILSAPLATQPAAATETMCSDPARAGPKASGILTLDPEAFAKLQSVFERAEPDLGMSTASVVGDTIEIYILQSPRVSVMIQTIRKPGSDSAFVSVERTCITDALEDWQPYWDRFLSALSARGLRLEADPQPRSGDDILETSLD
ncbi:hypothetical protein EEB18_015305 [Sphingopyxis sp. OPL5]|uniref:hypothetical protein n=1 Tax=Sphingopyxis sp. OPL5 TaxID=2486273 RepID=UPI00164E8446|nr:hypothetical protein [Sphingopyxis sp. OPL5]QNO26136.1 hypothetical protein EEB18_015305 [Sphingopyxis sp. OPL5]